MEGVSKQKIKYKREDGVDLTGDLYLPRGYDPKKDGKLPVIMWAYPAEFNSAADAAQIRGSEHRVYIYKLWYSDLLCYAGLCGAQ
jgi:dipeptidyl aminopeptidase/acylaminoacyl peptidase